MTSSETEYILGKVEAAADEKLTLFIDKGQLRDVNHQTLPDLVLTIWGLINMTPLSAEPASFGVWSPSVHLLRISVAAAQPTEARGAMAMATHVALLLVSALALVTSVQSGYAGSDWISGVAHATFYGGVDAQGTQGVNLVQLL